MFHSDKIESLNLVGLKILIFMIPLLPLFISPSMVFPYISGKNFAFRIIVEFAAVLWISLAVINKEYRPRNSTITNSILIFTIIVGMADLLGVNPHKSFWSNYERMEGYITVLHLVLYFLILRNVLRTKKDWQVFFNLLFAVSVLVGLYAFVMTIEVDPKNYSQYVMEYGTRVHSTIGNPPFLASYMLFSVFIGIALIINAQRIYLKACYLSAVLFNSLVVYMTGSRSAILAGAAGIVLSLIFVLRNRGISKKRICLFFMVFLLIVISAGSIVFSYSDFAKSSGEISAFDAQQLNVFERNVYRFGTMFSQYSVKTRLDAWGTALNAIIKRPLLGWGQENFIAVYTVNQIPLAREYIWVDRAHNIVIEWLVNAGFLGLISYLALFGTAFYFIRQAVNNKKIKRAEAVTLFIALVVYFVQNLLTFDTINTYFIFFALLAYIDNIGSIGEPLAESPENSNATDRSKLRYAGTLFAALLVFSLSFYYLNYKPIKQTQQSIKISASTHGSFLTLLEGFENSMSMNTFGNSDIRERMTTLSFHILGNKLFEPEGALQLIQNTAKVLWEGRANNRFNLEYYFKMITFYTEIAAYEPAYIKLTEGIIRECQSINPRFQWPYMAMADIYMLKKEYGAAFKIIKGIVDEDPGDDMKQMKLALAAILISREDIVTDTFENLKRIRIANSDRIASGSEPVFSFFELRIIAENYLLIKNYRQALYYYKEITDQSEIYLRNWAEEDYKRKMSNVYRRISQIHISLGEKEKAAKALEKALELGPENLSG